MGCQQAMITGSKVFMDIMDMERELLMLGMVDTTVMPMFMKTVSMVPMDIMDMAKDLLALVMVMQQAMTIGFKVFMDIMDCLLYTSDAADE